MAFSGDNRRAGRGRSIILAAALWAAAVVPAGFVAVTSSVPAFAQAQTAEPPIPVPRPKPNRVELAAGASLPRGDLGALPAGEAGVIAPAIGGGLAPAPGLMTRDVAFPGGATAMPVALLAPVQAPMAIDPAGKISDRLLGFGQDLNLAPPLDLTRGAAANAPLDLTPPQTPAALTPATAPLNLINPAFAVGAPRQDFRLEARLTSDGPLVTAGLHWRVFGEEPGADGVLPMVAEAEGGQVTVTLPPGTYLVHVAFGRAGATKRVEIARDTFGDELVLNAGGLQLHALVGRDTPLGGDEVAFDVFADDEDEAGERTMLLPDVAPDAIVRLNAGTYHVVSRYGDTNAVVRADIEVRPGALTEATIYHQAARVTLRLVNGAGRDAMPNTRWSVLTPGGDSVFDSVGAFPTVVLAAGTYTAVAQHDGQIFEGRFTVDSGINRDIEVIAQNPVVAGANLPATP